MLDPWIIDEIRKREEEQGRQPEMQHQLPEEPVELPRPPVDRPAAPGPSDRGFAIVNYQV